MNKREQKRFVRELSQAVVRETLAAITAGKTPATWDGHELRLLLADKFEASASMSMLRREPRSARTRNYNNTVLTENLA